jgi:hypothetical protein
MMRGMMGGGMQPVVTATERYVYVLRGDTLFQYSAEGLKLVAKATLPQDQSWRKLIPHSHSDKAPLCSLQRGAFPYRDSLCAYNTQ